MYQQELSIDIETFSPEDLKKAGVYRYSEHPDFQILIFGYRLNGDPVKVVDLTKSKIPANILAMITDPTVLKTAYNASFERVCLSRHILGRTNNFLDARQWDCTKVRASRLGWPMNLGATAKAMGLTEEKSETGKKLIDFFSIPCEPKKSNDFRTRNLPEHAPEKWLEFMKYCGQDVIVETGIRAKIIHIAVSEKEQRLWELDQQINDRGMYLNLDFVRKAQAMIDAYMPNLVEEAAKLTGLQNPNSVAQLKDWLIRQGEVLPKRKNAKGVLVSTLTADDVEDLLNGGDLSPVVERVLVLRQTMSMTSLKKYQAMIDCVCADGRARGTIEFNGANRTGRWAGRLFQPHNLPKMFFEWDKKKGIDDLLPARDAVLRGDLAALELMYGDVMDILSQLIRTSVEAKPRNRFLPADFSAIEARVIAWLAGEQWRLDVFATHGKIYEASAAAMFKVPIETIGKGSALRQRGKVAELALGYQGSIGALIKMGALKMGITKKELPGIVKAWRAANPAIQKLWKTMEDLMLAAIRNPTKRFSARGIVMHMVEGSLNIVLPSGRPLCYINARTINTLYFKKLTKDKDILNAHAEDPEIDIYEYVSDRGKKLPFMAGESSPAEKWVTHIVYDGLDGQAQYKSQDTYGGKIVENIVQAISRDCLAEAMMNLDDAGYRLVLHVHDEAVPEMPYGHGSTTDIDRIMAIPPVWGKEIPLKAESYETPFFRKD